MNHLLVFILATAGLTWIMLKSKLFKAFREFLTNKNYQHQEKNYLFWFLDNVFACIGCFGLWSGLINYYLLIFAPVLSYAFVGSICSLLVLSLLQQLDKR